MPESFSLPAFEPFGGRAFAFYPAIRNVEFNQWAFVRETWSEVLAKNSRTGQEVWIPRYFLGEISSSEEPVLIVGLKRELELKGGAVWPYQRTVIEMPPLPHPGTRMPEAGPAKAPRPSGSPTESKMGRLILYTLLMGMGACLLVVVFAFQGAPRPQDWFRKRNVATKDQQYLALTREDGYADVVRKLGPPDREQWITPESAEIHFSVLWYSQRSYAIVLMGGDRKDARYIGALHASSRIPLDSVPLPGGGTTTPMLRNLPKF